MPTTQELQQTMADLRQSYGQRIADYPNFEKTLRQQVYGSDTVLPTLQKSRDTQIQELWNVDQRLADKYANPSSNMYMRDPYARESAAAREHSAILGTYTGLDQLASKRKSSLDDILERGVKIYELGLNALEKEHGMANTELDNLLKTNKAGADTLSTADVLKSLNQTQNAPDATSYDQLPGDLKFKARVQGGVVPAQADLQDTAQQGFWGKLMNFLGRQDTGYNPTIQSTQPEAAVPPEIQQAILDEYKKTQPARAAATLPDTMAALGITPQTLDILGKSPTLDTKIATQLLQNTMFPKSGGSTSNVLKQKALTQLYDDLANKPGTMDNQAFLNALIGHYPELTPQEIVSAMKSVGYDFQQVSF